MGCGGSKSDNSAAKKGGGEKTKGEDKAKDRKDATAENKEYQAKMDFLAKVPLMKRLPKDQHPLVASVCEIQDFKKGDTIIKQGDSGEEFFVIREGEASVTIADDKGQSKKVATLKQGDYFGENALLRAETRIATITAETALSTFKIKRDKFQDLGLNDKLQFANRRAVGAGGAQETKAKPPSPKTDDEFKLIASAIRGNENLQTITTLDDARVKSFVDVMWKEEIPAGHQIITEGDLNADFFYVVQEGSFDVYVSETDESPGADNFEAKGDIGESKIVTTVSKGGSFGELALLYFVPRAATVKAKEQSTVWVIDRSNFKGILMKVSDSKLKDYVKYLDGVTMLQALISEEKKELAKALVEMHFMKDELIIQQGERGNTFYILYDGNVKIIKDGQEVSSLSASSQRGTAQYFGEKALMDSETRGATVQVTSETAKTLVLDRDSFNMLLGPLKDIIEKSNAGERSSMAGKGQQGAAGSDFDKPREKILRRDLTRIGLLGCGGFGTVELYEHKTTGETYAMKGLSKGYIVKTGMQDSVMNEKNILMMTNSVFVIKLHETYNGSQTLYFLLERSAASPSVRDRGRPAGRRAGQRGAMEEVPHPTGSVHSLISRILPVPSGSRRSDSGTIQLVCLLVITCISVVWVLLKLSSVLVPLTFAVFLAFLIEPVLSAITLAPQNLAAVCRRAQRRCQGNACAADGLPVVATTSSGDGGGGSRGAVLRGTGGSDPSLTGAGDPEAGSPLRGEEACEGEDELRKPRCTRMQRWLQGLWDILAIIMCVLLIFGVLYAIVHGLVQALTDFNWGKYQNSSKIQEIQELLSKLGVDMNEILSGAVFQQYKGEVVSVALKAVGVLESILLTLLLFFFVLAAMLPGIHQRKPRSRMKQLMQRYLLMKTIASFIIACAVMLSLYILKVELILIFGILTFTLNYIPNIGSFFAILAPVPLVALEPGSDITKVILVAVIPFAVHNTLGNIIEPKLMSQGLDLHPLTVVVALTFWGSMWGIAGAVLSVPMTCAIRLWLAETDHPYAKIIHRFFDSPMDAHHKSETAQANEASAFHAHSRMLSSSTLSTSTIEGSPDGVVVTPPPRGEQLGA